MSKQPLNKVAVKCLLVVLALILLLFILLLIFTIYLLPTGGYLVAYHLLFGFFHFLRSNLGAVSVNADTWVPGVLAMIIALVISHRFLTSWARRTDHKWTISSTFALGMILPVLFATAFLVPGILLQVKTLGNSSWFNRNRGQVFMSDSRLREVWYAALENASKEPGGGYPETLEHLLELASYLGHPRFETHREKTIPGEPQIYLGWHLRADSDPDLPMAISAPFLWNGEMFRRLIKLNGQIVQIRDEEADAWIQRVMEQSHRKQQAR